MTQHYEQFLIDTIVPQLERGRPGWDEPHTQEVVRYVELIAQDMGCSSIEIDMLKVVGYLHDYGYMYFVDELTVGPTGGRPKQEHAQKSLEEWNRIREEHAFDCFTASEKDRIGHLILMHDRVEELTDQDELIFMEADTLGALVMGNMQGIDKDQYQAYIERTKERRISRFISDYAQQEADRMIDLD